MKKEIYIVSVFLEDEWGWTDLDGVENRYFRNKEKAMKCYNERVKKEINRNPVDHLIYDFKDKMCYMDANSVTHFIFVERGVLE